MSKRGYISRYLLILKKLKATPHSSYEELKRYMENQLGYLQMQDDTLDIGFSKRTLQRDLREIKNIFGIDVSYSRIAKGYAIAEQTSSNMNFQRMMESFDMFNSLNLAHELSPYIHLEKRRPQGTENLSPLLHAIKNKQEIHFSYQKFWEEVPTERTLAPYALKEFKNRWYLLGKDRKDNNIKTFALDRLSALDVTGNDFVLPAAYDVAAYFRNCFGIISPADETVQEIILSFDPHQGKYIKTLPLHETQEILVDNADELQVRLFLYITHDLIMELLSYGAEMRVLAPASLVETIKAAHQEAFAQYD
ncbi:helix-turn-helix transcriptional regulator [Chitinophaga nivalis]|uniref:WYL domain-containing protein n=1 Tax=Chitinophaga nivalis TaxID=2991709 RepID=A0ABT3IG02_9BACT|nr:WYL domain-containing protein [Chitinophaga nivalis]MCW3467614.1 WYL domain-containing protein [Chitinophaga nivalis]MCW3482694.1 WYL domain-containing protein [Chitinophaga nivalis]